MPLQFILGPPGTGKTTLCLHEIEANISGTAPLYYLVPEQFSLQSERMLLSNRAATTRVQVLSFNRLAYRLFALLGGPPGQVADDLGKTMLLRKILLEIADDLAFYKRGADKHGFVDALAATITELNHYNIGSEDLQLRSDTMNPTLGAKLQDLALIAARYRAAVKGRYVLADDMLDLLVQKLAEENNEIPLLKGAKIWADGFAGFTPQERQVLLYLMKQGADVKITLTTRDTPGAAPDPLFATPRHTEEKLAALAKNAHITVLPALYMKENHRHAQNPGMALFAQNFSMQHKMRSLASLDSATLVIPGLTQNPNSFGEVRGIPGQARDDGSGRNEDGVLNIPIEILSAPDRYTAVYGAAHRVLTWVNSGYRFKDIAIVCGDRSHYEKTLQTAFDRLGIPLFIDTEIDIMSHPLTELIRAALSILAHNWSYEGVFRFLKTRLTDLDVDTIDILENYALAHGISGYRWQYEMAGDRRQRAEGRGQKAEKTPEIGRLHLLSALSPFGTGQAKDTVRGFSHKVFQMLYHLNVPETLQQWFDAHMAAGDMAAARVHKQIWPKICQVFDKLVEILGDEKVSLESFASILDAGLAQVGLGRIPPTVDQVVLGDTGRSRYPHIKAMLVLGANDGSLPPIAPSPGLLSEDERKQLEGSGIELAPDNLARINEQHYALYCTLCQPTEKLSFIYAEGEPGGKALRPSHVLKRLQALFPQLIHQKAPILREYDPLPGGMQDAPTVLEGAEDLYGPSIITAASRLEAFARCPFRYFMDYLLQARPRARYQVLPTDLGTLYHDVLARVTNDIAQGKVVIHALNRSGINDLVTQIITTSETEIFHTTPRNRHILNKVQGICAASIWAMCEQLKRGNFVPLGAELDFGMTGGIKLDDGRSLQLTGRIDRVDMLQGKDGRQYVRIIDYKSGTARFDMAELEQGTQLQLMLYMKAITDGGIPIQAQNDGWGTWMQPSHAHNMSISPAGVFYFPISDPIIDVDSDLGEDARDEALLKDFRMSGVTLDGEAVLQGMDKGLAPGGDSSVISLKLNKDGRISKIGKPLVLSPGDFAALGQVAEDKVRELGLRMVQGDIQARPCAKGDKSPCRHCNYGAICNGGEKL